MFKARRRIMSERGRGEITPPGSCFLLKQPRRPFNLPLSYWFISRRCCFFLLSSLMATPSLSWIHQASSSQVILPLLLHLLRPSKTDGYTDAAKDDGVQSFLQPWHQSRKQWADFIPTIYSQTKEVLWLLSKSMRWSRGEGRGGLQWKGDRPVWGCQLEW